MYNVFLEREDNASNTNILQKYIVPRLVLTLVVIFVCSILVAASQWLWKHYLC